MSNNAVLETPISNRLGRVAAKKRVGEIQPSPPPEHRARLNLAAVGCGQIFQSLHAPALANQNNVAVHWLIDKNPGNLKIVKKLYREAKSGSQIDDITDIDAAIIATPNGFHYEHVRYALEHGWHVLVEKPLATKIGDAEELVAIAEEKNLTLCVNLNRRFLPTVSALKALIQSREFGSVKKIELVDGSRCTGLADSAVTYHSSLELAGGGVLLGTGSHMIDLVDYLICIRSIGKVNYADDGFTNLEAECKFSFDGRTDDGPVEVAGFMSYISRSTQRITVHFDRAVVTAYLNGVNGLQVTGWNSSKTGLSIPVKADANFVGRSFAASITEFITSCRNRNYIPLNSASTCISSLRIIEQCYAQRTMLPTPWNETFNVNYLLSKRATKTKQCVGIIGAGGFLGSRLFERLMQSDSYYPRAITHSSVGSLSMLRYTDAVHTGDASDETFLKQALSGCEFVVNCAINTRGLRPFAIKATRKIAATAAKVAADIGIKRLIHISTIAVHGVFLGRKPDRLQPDPNKSTYSLAKYYSELDVLKQCRHSGLPSVILRMGHIYGPYSAGWSAGQRDLVRSGNLISVENWQNPSNTVFVDNAVDAIAAAMECPTPTGQIYYVTDWPNKSWRQFYEPLFDLEGKDIEDVRNIDFVDFEKCLRGNRKNIFYQMLDFSAELLKPSFSKQHIKMLKAKRKFQRLFDLIETVLPTGLIERIKSSLGKSPVVSGQTSIDDLIFDMVCCYASSIELPIEKTIKQLGYQPGVDPDKAAELTTDWLKYIE